MSTLNLLLSARIPLLHMHVNPSLHALLFYWFQEAPLPKEHGGSVLTTKPSHGRAPCCPDKEQELSSSTKWESAIL
jgi:hypothetical protein